MATLNLIMLAVGGLGVASLTIAVVLGIQTLTERGRWGSRHD